MYNFIIRPSVKAWLKAGFHKDSTGMLISIFTGACLAVLGVMEVCCHYDV